MNTNILQKIAVVLLTLSVFLAACTPSGGQRTIELTPLFSGAWHLVAYGNDDGLSVITPGLGTFIRFDQEGNLSGNAGCNNFFGTFEAKEDGSFSVAEPLGSTLMFCEKFMDEESAFLAALQSAERFEFNENAQLVIHFSTAVDGFDNMIFVNQPSISMLGTGWVLTSLVSPAGEIAIPPASAPLLNFSEDGGMTGVGGCNNIWSEFTADDGSIAFSAIASTRMYCEDLMDLEANFTAGLEQATRYEVTGDRLVLSDDSFSTVLTFVAAEFMLTETQWQLVVLNGDNIPTGIVASLTLSPADESQEGTVFGSTGCNRYSGTYTMEADRLTINILVVTAMMCENSMEIEAAFLGALQDELTFQITYNRLTLTSENNVLLFLGENPSLSGLWRVNTLGDPQNPVEMTWDQTILAEFSLQDRTNTGLITGTTPCYAYSARFFVDRQFIHIEMQETNALNQCSDGSELDRQFLEALENAAAYQFSRGGLLLRDVEGNQILEFSTQY